MIAGVEEAGRGPVVGNMVVSLVAVEEEIIEDLEENGITDSKDLTPERRDELYSYLQETTEVHTAHVTPTTIDEAIRDPASNLNRATADAMAALINQSDAEHVIVDCPSTDVPAFRRYLEERVDVTLEVKHKADRDETIVGAASIIAKVERDRHVAALEEEHDVTIGSGYPSDTVTQAFLDEYWDELDVFRQEWTTWQQTKARHEQDSLEEYSQG